MGRFAPVTLGSPRFHAIRVEGFELTEAWFPPNLRLPPHFHERACFAVMLEGAFDVTFAGRAETCQRGCAINEPAGEKHGNRVGGGGAHVLVVQPDLARFAEVQGFARTFDRIGHFRHGNIAVVAGQISREFRNPDNFTALTVEGLALELVALAARIVDVRTEEGQPPAWLSRVQEILHSQFLEPVRTAELAKEADVHPVHLARAFRTHHGVSIGSYVRGLRLDWAVGRLLATEDAIASIALEAGFADQSHFTRAFRNHTGRPPGSYRSAARS